MADRPDQVARVERILAAARIAHESIYELRRRLALLRPDDERGGALLAESAEIALTQLPAILAAAMQLRTRWVDQVVLDPPGAARTLDELAAELDRAAPHAIRMLGRQRRIAGELQALLSETEF
jgi:hypothetical protein